jgi:quinol-cytochrome oxidoreductase complex cytochrome b subunit
VNRRSLGRGRLIVVIGALTVIAGSLPAWWTIGGVVQEAQSGNAFDYSSTGIVVFLVGVAMLFLVVLPYATRYGEAAIDRPLAYSLLLLLAIVAFGVAVYQIHSTYGLGLPDRAPGLYITAAGLLILCWAMVELLGERPIDERRY